MNGQMTHQNRSPCLSNTMMNFYGNYNKSSLKHYILGQTLLLILKRLENSIEHK